MRKKLLLLVATAMLAVFFVSVGPKTEVQAKTPYEMTYDEMVNFWASQPGFAQIYFAEVNNSGFPDVVKYNIVNYLKYSLTETAFRADSFSQRCPMTCNFCKAVIAQCNPSVVALIYGTVPTAPLQQMLLDERVRRCTE